MTPKEPQAWILGIDGGGTKTVAWLALCDDPRQTPLVVGRGVAGGSNLQVAGDQRALQELDRAVAAAFSDAGQPRSQVNSAVAGLSGSDRDENRRIIFDWAARHSVSQRFRVTHDAEPVLAAASPEGWGVALIAGTGSLAYAVSNMGTTARAGGWGWLMGDEGSGYWIAVEGLRAATQAADGRIPPTQLLTALLAHLKCREPSLLIPAVYGMAHERAQIAALAEVVIATAHEGDEAALEIVTRAACQLAEIVRAAAIRAEIRDEPIPVAVTGGVLLRANALFDRFAANLTVPLKRFKAPVRVDQPVWGAVLLAQKELSRNRIAADKP
jgi:N-acetylglucosamine kinase-like BadF-type ATPase